jgi:DNA-binding MarR family transcriptional regulator
MASIEEEISQKTPFSSSFEKMVVNILFTANWIEAQEREFLKQYHITTPQYNILRILRGQYPNAISIVNIRNRMLDKTSDVSRLVERLRKQGYVSRIESSNDRRMVDVIITQKGLELLNIIYQERQEQTNFFPHFSEQEAQKVNELLDKLRTNQ